MYLHARIVKINLSDKYKGYFCLPRYSRIIQLWPRMLLPLAVLMHYLKGEETGISLYLSCLR
ncbi:putative transposase [Orientia tsutsugamushi str. UT76]|uniref:Transposase n=1 Tax=Orientia tsutsugamushi TaxID=784 RepID=A0A2U3QT50_ORITS|nr:putative transposase [Orientia tsutsugamushi str. UT76]SPR04131.1 transposase [Orientia tsutsugamushi]